MRTAVVLGGYGLIGAACMRALLAAGWVVVGVGRSPERARGAPVGVRWVWHDISRASEGDWRAAFAGADVVINASGALGDGPLDDVEAIHVQAVARWTAAARGEGARVVQISAAGARLDASTEFLRSKARGDALVAALPDWIIVCPVLVLGPQAYGGTALLRAVAALPGLAPQVLDSRVQTVHVDDVAAAVVAAAEGRIPNHTIADLAESQSHRFGDVVDRLRAWQGYEDPLFAPRVPGWALRAASGMADALGRLGWRSPLRSAAVQVLREGVRGDPVPWALAGGAPMGSLDATLARMPATAQERLFARSYVMLPVAIATLAVFWVASGAITLLDVGRAQAVLGAAPAWLSAVVVVGGAMVDIGLGLAIAVRRTARLAAWGMVAVAASYCVGAALFAPGLWADPLGPMVKVIPGLVLAAWVGMVVEKR